MERVCVECRQDTVRGSVPRRIGFAGAMHDVVEIVDEWAGEDHHYFRLRTDDDAHFLVRLDETVHAWCLISFDAAPHRPPPSGNGSG